MTPAKTIKLNKSQGFALVESFLQSGLSARDFSIQENIKYHVLKYWRVAFDKESVSKKRKTLKFLPLQLPKLLQQSSSATLLKIQAQSGLILEVPAGFDINSFKEILKACLSCG